jgi:hypothetical protein
VRPRCMTPRMPRVFDTRKRLGKRPVARWGYAWVKRGLSFRACGARPFRGASPRRMALRGKPGHNAGGGFLGGTRSARPGGVRPYANQSVSLHDLGWPVARGPTGRCLGQAPSPAGVRSPPLQGWTVQAKMALRGKPWHDAKADFLGGAHSVRPLDTAPTNAKAFHYGQGVGRIAGPLLVTCLASARALLPGVRSPPLGGEAERNAGFQPGRARKSREKRFSWRGALRAPAVHDPSYAPGFRYPKTIGQKARRPMGICLGEAWAFVPGVRSPPLHGQANPRQGAFG